MNNLKLINRYKSFTIHFLINPEYLTFKQQDSEITELDLQNYDGVVDIKYLKYANIDPNGESNPDRANTLSDPRQHHLDNNSDESFEDEDYMAYYHEDNFSDDSEDRIELVKRGKPGPKKFNGRDSFAKNGWSHQNDYGTISEKPGEEDMESVNKDVKQMIVYGNKGKRVRDSERKYELGDEEERLSAENKEKRKKDKKSKKKKKDKESDKKKGKNDKRKSKKMKKKESEAKRKEKEVEKKFKIFEYDIDDNNMVFEFKDNPKTLKKVGLGHSIWLSAILYIEEKDLLVTGGYDDHSVKLWRLDRDSLAVTKLGEYKNHRNHITKLMYDSKRDYLMVGSQDCSFSVVSLENIKSSLGDDLDQSETPLHVEQR